MKSGRNFYHSLDILALSRGRLVSGKTSLQSLAGVEVDSRKVQPGYLFVALHGERTDGHRFLADAAARGASALLVSEAGISSIGHEIARLPVSLPVIAVNDSLTAMQDLAEHWTASHPSLTRIAITGSSGKTTTKEMIGSILNEMGTTVRTPGNLNSEIGLPLSLFQIDDRHEFGVFELGISRIGEMDRLVSLCSPQVSVMTNVGPAHFSQFGSLEAIAREKGKIFHPGVRHGYIHEKNVWKSSLRYLRGMEFREFGRKGTKGFSGAQYLGLDGWRIFYEDRSFRIKHVGIHNLYNALAAISIVRDLGAEPEHIARGLESLDLLQGRSRILQGAFTVIEDCYNANLDSTSRILDYMRLLRWNGRKAVILGAMKELGAASAAAHEAIGRKVEAAAPEAAFFFGEEMEPAYRIVKHSRRPITLKCTDSYEELERSVTEYVRDGDLLLLKGSRAMAMERLLAPLGMAS